ncbi:MAG: MTH938/NDUFAF3 family protein [Mariprofundaceae bacterium]
MLAGGSFQADVSPDIIDGTPLIRAYDDDYIQVGRQRYQTGIAIHAGNIVAPWGAESIKQLKLEHFQIAFEPQPEIIILGTGRLTCFPNESILAEVKQQHIGFECMDSRAACRTYNILVAEGRRVTCLLLLPKARNR